MTEAQPPSPPAPRRNDIVPFSNAVLFIVFCLLAGTGLALAFRLEDGGATLLGVTKRDWAKVHAITALSVLSLVVFHLWANWPWVRSTLARLRWQTVMVASLGLAVLTFFLVAPVR
jgi:hypothetical protein